MFINNENESIIDVLISNSQVGDELDIFVAYISIKALYDLIEKLGDRFNKIRIYLGKRVLASTKILRDSNGKVEIENPHKSILKSSEDVNVNDDLSNIGYELKINNFMKDGRLEIFSMVSKNDQLKSDAIRRDIYHGKVYLVKRDQTYVSAIVGSHNLTRNAMESKFKLESSFNTSFKANETSLLLNDEKIKEENLDFFKEIVNGKSAYYAIEKINDVKDLLNFASEISGNYFKNLLITIESDGVEVDINNSVNVEKAIEQLPYYDIFKSHQQDTLKEIVLNLLEYGGAFLSFPTGMGKTWVAFAVAHYFANLPSSGDNNILILVPNEKLKEQWKNDHVKMLDSIVGIDDKLKKRIYDEFLPSEDNMYSYRSKDIRGTGDLNEYENIKKKFRKAKLIIIEESHNLRNSSTGDKNKLLDLIKDLIKDSRANSNEYPAVLLITATPINNRLLDLFNQTYLFPQSYNNHNILERRNVIKKMDDKFQSRIKNYEKEKKATKTNDVNFLNELINNNWSEVVGEAFTSSEEYENYSKFISDFIFKGSNKELIDDEFNPDNDTNDNNYNNHVQSGNYNLDNDLIQEMIDIFLDRDNDEPLFGSNISADRLFETTFFKSLESSPSAALGLIEKFVKDWKSVFKNSDLRKAEFDEEKLEKVMKKQVNAESRARGNLSPIEIQYDLAESEDGEFDRNTSEINLKLNEKIEDKRKWLLEVFAKEETQEIYRNIISNLELIKINFEDHPFIDETFFKKNKRFEKEFLLYNNLKTQVINGGRLKNLINKTLIFAHYKKTAEYLTELIKRFDFVIKANKILGNDIDDMVFNASPEQAGSAQVKWVNEFSKLSRIDKKDWINWNDNEVFDRESLEKSIMVATDNWSEGHNLQDASLLISYDTHWNPMRIMQRVGRIIRIPTKELKDYLYTRMKVKKKIVYYWLEPHIDVIKNFVDLNRIVSFKMMQSMTSGFEYPLTFSDYIKNNDEGLKRIRKIIANSTRGGSNDEKISNDKVLHDFYGNWISKEDKDIRKIKKIIQRSSGEAVDGYYNGTVVMAKEDIKIGNNILFFIVEHNKKMMIVPIMKNKDQYETLNMEELNSDVFSGGEILYSIFEESENLKVVNYQSSSFILEDEDKIKSALLKSMEKFNDGVCNSKHTIKYYAIYIKERE